MTLMRVNAALYDLQTDWSNTINPNGVWSSLVNGLPAVSGVRGNDTFGPPGPPTIWGSGHVGWSQSNGSQSSYLDIQVGDIYGHSAQPSSLPISITWTSPDAGTVQVDGGAWMLRDIGRSIQWTMTLNGNTVEDTGNLFSGDPFSRSAPDAFHFTTPVQPGDVLAFTVVPTSSDGDYVGVNFTVTTVPEPSTMLFGLISIMGVAFRRNPNRRKG